MTASGYYSRTLLPSLKRKFQFAEIVLLSSIVVENSRCFNEEQVSQISVIKSARCIAKRINTEIMSREMGNSLPPLSLGREL